MKQIIKATTVVDAMAEVIKLIDARLLAAGAKRGRAHTVHDRQFAEGAIATLAELRDVLSDALVVPNRKPRQYFTLLERGEDGIWQIAFGDYDREAVAEEMRDILSKEPRGSRSASRYQIIESGPSQAEIDAEVGRANRLGPLASIPTIVTARNPRKIRRDGASR
jgi:hypothetical protein